jgi:hypothetical protein
MSMQPHARRRRFHGCLLAVAAAAVIPACTGSNSPTAATSSAAARTTETFSGTVTAGGRDVHNFPVAAEGAIDVTLTAVAPTSAAIVGISLGMAGGNGCTVLAGASALAAAGSAPQLSGIVTPGTMCVDVHDPGTLTATVSYTITVLHP